MTEINLGKIAITNKGMWSKSVPYDILTAVSHNGQSFLSIVPNIGIDPDTDKHMETWLLLAKKGEDLYEMFVNAGKFTGTKEEFIQQYQDALDRIERAIKEAKEASSKVDSSIENINTLSERIKKEETERVSNESKRNSNESERISQESQRVEKDSIREEKEAVRENTFNSLKEEFIRFQNRASKQEEERVIEENKRKDSEKQRTSTFDNMKIEVKKATDIANEASAKALESVLKVETSIEKNILALDMDNASGDIIISCGEDNSAFTDGVITDEGKIELNFNY